jgi:ADP-heptose:LPS heptosyltransferase
MPHQDPTQVLAESLLAIRRFLAPPGSYRETIARAIYVPIFHLLMRRQALAKKDQSMQSARCIRFQGLAERVRLLPEKPRILVLKLDHIGDFILAMPAMEHLRASFPDGHLTLACGSWNRDWAEQSGLFDRVVTFDFFAKVSGERSSATSARLGQFAELGIDTQDLAIDLRHDPDTRRLLMLVRATFRAGFCAPANMGGERLDIALPDVEEVSIEAGTGRRLHAEQRLLLLAHAVTDAFRPKRHPAWRLLSKAAIGGGTAPYAILAPGAGSPIRIWPIDKLIAVGRALVEQFGLEIVVIGAPADDAAGQMITKALPQGSVRNMIGLVPLRELPDIVNGARIYVGYDTGTTHLAAALGVPTVSILSGVPSAEVWCTTGQHVIVVAGEISCSPCYLVHASQCPYGVECLRVISVQHVLDACREQLLAAAPAPL